MRVSRSITHDKKYDGKIAQHRVIIPLYIPHENDYYKDSFKIFTACVTSLYNTQKADTPVSVIANGCSTNIHSKLLKLQQDGFIDELLLETEQLGKINSLRRVIAASDEPFLTITDGDVMFLNNWDREVATIFENIPRATAVSPVPVFKTYNQYTSNIWIENLWNGKVKFEKPEDPAGLVRFANSIGWSYLNDYHSKTILTYTHADVKTVVGCSHFCTTYKREALLLAPQVPSEFLLSGSSEAVYLDIPTIKCDGYRLSTTKSFAFHLGNTWEEWMDEELETLNSRNTDVIDWGFYSSVSNKPIKFWIKSVFLKKLMFKKNSYNFIMNQFKVPEVYKDHYLK